MKKSIVALSVFFASGVSAFELNEFDINPMIGASWASDTSPHYEMNSALTLGAEVIYDNRFMVGFSGAKANRSRDMYGAPESENKFKTVYGGYFVDDNLAIKLGASFQTHDTTSTAWTPNGEQTTTKTAERTYAMIGAGYYFQNDFNVSLHLNIPVSGDPFIHSHNGEELDRKDFMMTSLMIGYRF